MRVLEDHVAVRRATSDEQTDSGIVIPENARERKSRGTVVAVGPGRLLPDGRRGDMQLAVGDVILFGAYAGSDIEIEDEELLILKEEDVYCVLE